MDSCHEVLADEEEVTRPRYARANRSKVIYTRNYHLHWWSKQPASYGTQSGVSLKQRRDSGIWRHWTLKKMTYRSNEKGHAWVRHWEAGFHDSLNAKGDRITGSKRYLRFKVCL